MIEINKRLRFVYGTQGNRVVELPTFLKSVFEDEYSPVRLYMQTVEPDVIVDVTVTVMTYPVKPQPARGVTVD